MIFRWNHIDSKFLPVCHFLTLAIHRSKMMSPKMNFMTKSSMSSYDQNFMIRK